MTLKPARRIVLDTSRFNPWHEPLPWHQTAEVTISDSNARDICRCLSVAEV